jgi:hypothetical protein
VNDFDELIGADVTGAERERLRGVHDMLVQAGPPAELPDSLHNAPRPSEVGALRKQSTPRKLALLVAAIIVLGITFSIGFSTGQKHAAPPSVAQDIALNGTAAAPRAQATLAVLPEVAGNSQMNLSVRGLPQVSPPEYYDVWLVRKGEPWGMCGEFVVSRPTRSLTLTLNAPYSLETGDTWIVTRHKFGESGVGTTVLQPRGLRPSVVPDI